MLCMLLHFAGAAERAAVADSAARTLEAQTAAADCQRASDKLALLQARFDAAVAEEVRALVATYTNSSDAC
jgi:hypothetical protein